MATLQEIQDFLDIEIGDKRLRPGKKYKNKNKYYYYEDQYYIVMLTQGKWMIAEDCKKTRRLLRLNCWCVHTTDLYAQTRFKNTSKKWHQLFLNYEDTLTADHLNRKRHDNRFDNLRVVSRKENCKNLTKSSNNTSGKQGVNRFIRKRDGSPYWRGRIHNNGGKEVAKHFSINKFGEQEAKRLAIEWRKQKEEEYGYIGD